AKVDEEELIRFGRGVALYGDADGLTGLTGREGQGSTLGDVVAVAGGGSSVSGRVFHGDIGCGRVIERHGEGEGGGYTAAAFLLGDVGDGQNTGIVVVDSAGSLALGDGRISRAGKDPNNGFRRFGRGVALDLHGELSAGLPGRESQCAAGGYVVV